jgi:hypothetical protein
VPSSRTRSPIGAPLQPHTVVAIPLTAKPVNQSRPFKTPTCCPCLAALSTRPGRRPEHVCRNAGPIALLPIPHSLSHPPVLNYRFFCSRHVRFFLALWNIRWLQSPSVRPGIETPLLALLALTSRCLGLSLFESPGYIRTQLYPHISKGPFLLILARRHPPPPSPHSVLSEKEGGITPTKSPLLPTGSVTASHVSCSWFIDMGCSSVPRHRHPGYSTSDLTVTRYWHLNGSLTSEEYNRSVYSGPIPDSVNGIKKS